MMDLQPGPCVICGDINYPLINYPLSCGGPTICPQCDCGHSDAVTIIKQAEVIKQLRVEIEQLRGRIEQLERDWL